MSEHGAPRGAQDGAREVEEDLEALPDPEGGPANPAGTLAMGASASHASQRAGTRREIWRLALPVMASMTLASAVGMIDVWMMKGLGATAQAAVGFGSQAFMLAQAVLFALSFACVSLMARAIGAKQPDEARRALATSLSVALGVGVVLFVLMGAEPRFVLSYMNPEPAVLELAAPYLQLVMAATVLMSLSLTFESALRANRDTFTPMLVTALVTAAKVGLNALLIFGVAGVVPPLGVAGAGWATLGAQAIALLGFAFVLSRAPAESPLALRARDFSGMTAMAPALLRVAAPGVVERAILQGAMFTYVSAVGTYGTYAAAAYTIGVRLLSFSWIPGNGFSQAAATIVGQSLGAGDLKGAERATRRAASLSVAVAIAMGVIAALADRPLAEAFAADPHTVDALIPFMMCLAIAQPFMQLHFTLAGAFRGAGDTVTSLIAAVIGNWVFRVPFAWLVTSVLHADLIWVWAVLMLDHVARAIWLVWSFRRRDWAKRLGGLRASP
jgi:putative MATE family efflux protein